MASASTKNNPYNQPFLHDLSRDQEDLLLAALSSNNPNGNTASYSNSGRPVKRSASNTQPRPYFTSPQQVTPATDFDTFNMDDSPSIDFLDADGSFSFYNDPSDLMIGSLPGSGPGPQIDNDGEAHEKRKSPDDENDDDENETKRREPDDKQAKKPGRKPLTSEPTTKRKAQNRAAQRAFRERKEKHLKDLETKVQELEKTSSEANQENGVLRAQVERLQVELREYRKRLSLNASSLGRSPPLAGSLSSQMAAGNNSLSNSFQFEFPRFGGLPTAHMFGSDSMANTNAPPLSKRSSAPTAVPSVLPRNNSNGQSMSPRAQPNGSSLSPPNKIGSSFSSPQRNGSSHNSPSTNILPFGLIDEPINSADGLDGLFSPSLLNGFGAKSTEYGFSNAPANVPRNRGSTDSSRVFQFNGGSTASNTESPSASSVSQYGQNQSTGTSPEPSHASLRKSSADRVITNAEDCGCDKSKTEGEKEFCEQLNMACGTRDNPIPRAISLSNAGTAPAAGNTNTTTPASNAVKTPAADVNGIDWFANQNGGLFDPMLFGDYRESQAAIVGDGDFTGGLFDDTFNYADFGSPLTFPTPAPLKPNPIEEMERLQDGVDEDVVPANDSSQLLSCHSIWDKLSKRPDFKDGSIDIDNLCSELRSKARCSESGVVIDQKDVDAALRRLPAQQHA
ncbi:DNA-binding transcription factor yap1 [Coniosporium apollinis]|uniref:DNA-binding transcription factor yap1 n=1 Tax=Coniosporium apollinis TaxID=61459 RepID=A0ABQ9NY61_9PEZI|nr:DNA-binding transcription factor yap1 [Coniosporium apollinis]